jgi:hypothetical protein
MPPGIRGPSGAFKILFRDQLASPHGWLRHLSVGMAILSAGCAAGADGSVSDVARTGYMYHDANHTGGTSQASPPAVYNATHGTWLWPPAATPH